MEGRRVPARLNRETAGVAGFGGIGQYAIDLLDLAVAHYPIKEERSSTGVTAYLARTAIPGSGTLPAMVYDSARDVNVLADGTFAAFHPVLGRTSTMTKMRETSDVD